MLTPSRQLTDAEKLRKVISELVDTERAYVKVSERFCRRAIDVDARPFVKIVYRTRIADLTFVFFFFISAFE